MNVLELKETPSPLVPAPVLVLIWMTPLEARVPYSAAAAGPLRTEMDSMSSGLTSIAPFPKSTSINPLASSLTTFSKVVLLIGIPSTTNRGLVLVKELSPRMVMRVVEPTPVDPPVMVTPATRPARLSKKLALLT